MQSTHIIFTDGSSLGNPGPGGFAAVIVINGAYVTELGAHVPHTTNNRMELFALVEGLKRLKDEKGALTIFLDSQYVHKGATEWVHGWKKRRWMTSGKTPVEHRDLWEELDLLLIARAKLGKISFTHVPGHSGIVGNERCDEIATSYAQGSEPGLYHGPLADYAVDILNITIDEKAQAKRSLQRAHARTKAYSYLSLVAGVANRHATWAECEKRVQGKKGEVKYKKSISAEDERYILQVWGVQLKK